MDGDRDKVLHQSNGLSPQGPNEEQKEGEHEKGCQDREECVHPLIHGDWSNESSPRPAGLGLNEHVIKPDSLNVADNEGWLRSQGQWHWVLIILHWLALWELSLFGCSPSKTWMGRVNLDFPQGRKPWLLLGLEKEEEREWGELEGIGRRGESGNFYK